MIAVGFMLLAAAASLVRAAATSSDELNKRLAGTLAMNVVGAFALGLLSESGASTQIIVGVGGLGALTTFSSFVAQMATLVEAGRRRDAAGYLLATLVLGIGAAWVGMELT